MSLKENIGKKIILDDGRTGIVTNMLTKEESDECKIQGQLVEALMDDTHKKEEFTYEYFIENDYELEGAKIILFKEQKLDKNFTALDDMKISVYISYHGIKAWIAYAENVEQVRKLIEPKNIKDLLYSALSTYDFYYFIPLLEKGMKYTFYDEEYTCI